MAFIHSINNKLVGCSPSIISLKKRLAGRIRADILGGLINKKERQTHLQTYKAMYVAQAGRIPQIAPLAGRAEEPRRASINLAVNDSGYMHGTMAM